MVNAYFLRTDNTTPSGYTNYSATAEGRTILLGGTPLSTGGATTHTHGGSAVTNTYTADITKYYAGTSAYYQVNGNHSHSVTVTSIGTSNNYPTYKTYNLVYKSISGWNGSVSSGCIVFSESVPTGWTRVNASQTHFIVISATAGSTGGADTPSGHSISGSVDNLSQSPYANNISDPTNVADYQHGHGTYSDTSGAHNSDYKYWGCGLISADADNKFIQKDSFVLFDGDPGAKWTLENQTDRYVKVLGTYTPGTGGTNTIYSHTHSKDTTSGACSNYNLTNNTPAIYSTCYTHTHTITTSLASANAQPPYVRLLLYKALSNFGNKARSFTIIM